MIAAVFRTALWLGVFDALAGAALLGFLYTPEANVPMLAVSTLLIVVAGVLLLLSSTSASHGLVHGVAPWSSVSAAARHLPLVLVVLVVLGVLCGGAGWFETWWMSRAGEVDAAAIVAGNITRTGWVHTAVHWIVVLVQWVLVPAWFATALAWIAGYERRDVLTLKWLTAGLEWRLLLVTLAGVMLLVWVPWRYVYWRPRILSASSVEVVFAGAKLLFVYLLAQVAWALSLWAAARRVPTPSGTV
ncbi:hypothetical protein LuPra_03144 [Luteitalea pratensis]|uniref:Uncharacterized protein n=1 Tax=Luteitalea pratensis TaxID=1855912 RepID=A0A143PMS1_LUTPR|nr:hypothetical protein [Luteitalea pratensis]AMY09917.1 hypothetical protein LuPra_03144 [Luteitalea pratensis]